MKTVVEVMSSEPLDLPVRTIERSEAGLFAQPPEAAKPFLGSDLPPLAVFSFPVIYTPVPFARPRGVFEGSTLRLEWQTMAPGGRQPFYHRNTDVDEIGYQICGSRALITECGTVAFLPGQFARIPLGVAHDNYGLESIHLILYFHGPISVGLDPIGHGEHRIPPFAGWQNKPTMEVMTNAMGGPGGTIAYSMADEETLLRAAVRFVDPLELLEPKGPPGETEWVYRSPKIWIGHTLLEQGTERRYNRRICADEIQYQAEGTRTIVSQRGVLTLQPGDFTCIPRGCAYASITSGSSKYLSIVTAEPVPPVVEPTRFADLDVRGWLAAADADLETSR